MNNFKCPYCQSFMSLTPSTVQQRFPSFDSVNDQCSPHNSYDHSTIALTFYKCPCCNSHSIFAYGLGDAVEGVSTWILPKSNALQFPDYIPKNIREDYEESCAIVNLSPKASATLSRRCLQGMIRDFWGIKESNLSKAIEKLEGKVPTTQWKVIDAVRRIGNIGAHMEKDINLIIDIDPGEAEKLIKLIEHLLDQWYINRHEEQQLYADIIDIDETKQHERKKTE